MAYRKIRRRSTAFCGLRTVNDLSIALDTSVHSLQLQAGIPHYDVFYIRKRRGGKRLIENPSTELKSIQRKLNRFLQAVYYEHKTEAAYGFIINVKNRNPRNIVTNARRHLDAAYCLKLDFKDFFHSIDKSKVYQLFKAPPFGFSSELAQLLSKLCCFKSRLPMGAPTSPVLSNLYSIPLDSAIHNGMEVQDIVYTRYADDMSFSANYDFADAKINWIKEVIEKYGLVLNPRKTERFGPSEIKVITGIYVSDHLSISPELLTDTRKEIAKLRTVVEIALRHRKQRPDWIKEYKQRIAGYLEFAGMVQGHDDPLLRTLKKEYQEALHPPRPVDPVSWSELPYFS